MATSIIRPSGGGDYTSFAAWAADVARIPGDVAECDEAGTQTLPVTITVSDQTMRATVVGVIVQCAAPSIPLSIDMGITGFVCEDIAFDQTGIGVGAMTFQADSAFTMNDCTFDGDTYAVYAAVVSTGAVVFDGCTFTATDPASVAIRATSFANLTMSDCLLVAVERGLWANSLAGLIERCKIRVGLYPIKASGTWIGIGDDLRIESCELQCNAASGGDTAITFDTYTIPTGKTFSFSNCTLVGSTANVLTNHNGLLIDPQNSPLLGTFTMRNIIVSGFNKPYRVTGIDAEQDFCCFAPVPLNGDTPSADTYANKAYVAGADDIALDPEFYAVGDFRLGSSSPCLGAGTDVGVLLDADSVPFESPPPIGAYMRGDNIPPDVVDGTATSLTSIVVNFSEEVVGADLTSPVAWAVERVSTGLPRTVTGITVLSPTSVRVNCASMLQVTEYRVTAPATLEDLAGNLIDNREAIFTTARYLTVYHESEQGLRVIFNADVKQVSELESDDALNPSQYLVVRDDAGWYPALLTVIPRTANEVTLKFAGPEVRRFEYATLNVSGLIAYTGGGFFPACEDHYEGCADPDRPLLAAIEKSVGIQDIKMPLFGTEAGTLSVVSGDYQMETAQETMKKLVIRALSLATGEFAHAPEFGSLPKIKSLAKPSELQRVARDAKNSLLSLPNVLDAMVTTSAYNNGVLRVDATVKTRHLGTIAVSWAPAGAV